MIRHWTCHRIPHKPVQLISSPFVISLAPECDWTASNCLGELSRNRKKDRNLPNWSKDKACLRGQWDTKISQQLFLFRHRGSSLFRLSFTNLFYKWRQLQRLTVLSGMTGSRDCPITLIHCSFYNIYFSNCKISIESMDNEWRRVSLYSL